MADRVIEKPIINSPYRPPGQHFKFDVEGITNEIVAGRRPSSYFVPVPRPRKRGVQQQLELGELTGDQIEKNEFINAIRERVGRWRDAGYPEVTAIAVRRYLDKNRARLPQTMYSEQQVQVHVAPGITIDGRIDLIRRLDTNETSIVDFKSSDRVQAGEITRDQLHVFAVGYQELTGENAVLVEVLNLDEKGDTKREVVNNALLTDIRRKIHNAGDDLRTDHLPRLATWCTTCDRCDHSSLCREHPA